MMPPASPRIATSAKGMRNQVGRMVASAPMGSESMAVPRAASDPTSMVPAMTRTTQGREEPKAVQPMTPGVEAVRGR